MKSKRLIVRTIILLILVGALGYTLYSSFFTEKVLVGKGDMAPNFVITDLAGNEIEFDQYRGKGVFLNFWATWCPPCEEEMPYMENQYKTYKDQGVEVLAINVAETKLSVENFVERKGLTFPIVIDETTEIMEAYGVDPLPTTFLIDKDGKIIDIIKGSMSDQIIQSHMERIKP
ncbi:thiol-disulfide oxidoreductase ResA [Calidifontibacillus oryziterrae]|uniref:thiol-disulfide oxidoreductase ResA n=1 Tax=Calidifontibacillus oryziterrae TaxID=1191699 RepID=UPI00030E0443|nr:thiol-disulfide oxidoreductase ResA [Calidifontibacillus oryziterrae]